MSFSHEGICIRSRGLFGVIVKSRKKGRKEHERTRVSFAKCPLNGRPQS